LLDKDKDLNIICAGGPVFTRSEIKLFNDLNLSTRIHRFAVTDEVLAWLYKKALAFVFPSLYEGFGIPVLEAFSCGCPTVLSNTSSLTEIGSDAAIYFEPDCEDSIAHAVGKVIYNKELRADLKTRGFRQAENFSWAKTAYETEALYKTVV
jgi:glycosyltransferase involved in cell wall biosynthesis